MLTALEIARQATLKPISEIAEDVGVPPWLTELHGDHVAKIDLKAIEELQDRPKAKYVVVTAITPTPLGEGKTTTTIGLARRSVTSGRMPRSPSGRRRWGPRSASRGSGRRRIQSGSPVRNAELAFDRRHACGDRRPQPAVGDGR